jgi:hypothetical protein
VDLVERGDMLVLSHPRDTPGEAPRRLVVLMGARGRAVHRRVVLGRADSDERPGWHACVGTIDEVRPRRDDLTSEHRAAGQRLMGAGVYGIFAHGDHGHFAYVLEEPASQADGAQDRVLSERGSYLLEVKGPRGRRRFALTTELLDEEGAEIALFDSDPSARSAAPSWLAGRLGSADEAAAATAAIDELLGHEPRGARLWSRRLAGRSAGRR